MKKILLITSLIALLIAPQAQALTISSLSISPTAINITKGQTFTVSLSLNPAGSPNYTTKAVIDYPANLVRLNSFTFANGWMPLAQNEYDLIDNTNGKMIKTGGFPGGISSFQLFGTASFTSLESGAGAINASIDSFSLDGSNVNTLSATLPSAILSIQDAAAPPPTPTPTPVEEPEEIIAPEPGEEPEEIPIEETTPIPITTPGPEGQATIIESLGNVLTIGTNNIWIGIFVGLVLLAVIAQIIRKAIGGNTVKKEEITTPLPEEDPPKPKTKPRKPTPKKK
ncbi:hypothetical protein CL629_04815 [bacterium]|nr:hypothetical protein [bacterium]|tara:strand:+ start:192 stop:1040 length:849 start_codon:yes stop_codon:yes gene_type:complete